MRDYRPGLNDLRQALGGVLARSLTDEDLAAYKRAKLVGIDVGGGEASPRTGSTERATRWAQRTRSAASFSRAPFQPASAWAPPLGG